MQKSISFISLGMQAQKNTEDLKLVLILVCKLGLSVLICFRPQILIDWDSTLCHSLLNNNMICVCDTC